MANFSPVDLDEIQETTKMVEHKLVSFAAVVALWTLLTLLNANSHRPKVEIQDKSYAILATMLRKRSYCLKNVFPVTRAGVFIWENYFSSRSFYRSRSRLAGKPSACIKLQSVNTKINHMRSNLRHKISFQDIVYFKS